MPTNSPVVDARSEWFVMIMSYLKVKALAFWFQCHPESTYEQFESVWPALLDQMLLHATNAAIEELKTRCQTSLN